jgi:type I restriction enzyme, S subunit
VPEALKGWNVARAIAVVRPQPDIGAEWINICLQTQEVHQFLNERANTTVQKTLNLSDVREIPILIPPSEIKNGIESVALALSEKISLNNRINQTLEQMAQAIFKSWFVDFDPVRAKMAGRQPEGMDAATAELFPDELEESELGLTPKGWGVLPLYDTASYVNGAAFKAADFSQDGAGLPIVKIVELKQGVSVQTKFTEKDFQQKYFIDSGDVCYSWSGSPETSLDVFKWFGGKGWLNQHIFKLNFSSDDQKYFTFYLLKQMRSVLVQTALDKQTTGLGHVTVADMKRIKVVYPDSAVLRVFRERIGMLYEQSSQLEIQCATLKKLRDTLLPKLLSGAVGIKEI